MQASRRERCTSAILFALPWPLPVYLVSGSFCIVLNERVLGAHVLDASRVAEASALLALLAAAAWSQHVERAGAQPRAVPEPRTSSIR